MLINKLNPEIIELAIFI